MRASASRIAFPVTFGAVGVLAVACSQHSSNDLNVSLAPTLVFPRGVLDNVQKLTVTVYDAAGGLDCDLTKGVLSGLGSQAKVATKDLGTSCQAPAKLVPRVRRFSDTAGGRNRTISGKRGCGFRTGVRHAHWTAPNV